MFIFSILDKVCICSEGHAYISIYLGCIMQNKEMRKKGDKEKTTSLNK